MNITTDELYIEILMMRNMNSTLTILLLEGESDVGALYSHLVEDMLIAIPADGKKTALGAVDLAEKSGLTGILAVLDRDWDGKLYKKSDSPNVVYTDHYDIDATAFFTNTVARRVIANFSDTSLVKKHIIGISASNPIAALTSACAAVGLLRFTSAKYGHGLSMRDFPINAVLDCNKIEVDAEKLIHIALKRSSNVTADESTIKAHYQAEVASAESDIRYYCSGHDLLASLSHVSSKKWGGEGGAKNIGRAIRAAFGTDDLIQTSIYKDAASWEHSSGFQVWSIKKSSNDTP